MRVSTFIGIDLAWSDRNRTGLVVLRWKPDEQGVELTRTTLVQTDEEIARAVVESSDEHGCLLAIDAPIIAPNPAGTMRACDRQVAKDFSRFHAGPYPANRERCARPIRLRKRLEREGFSPDPVLSARSSPRRQLEIFPHPAQVVLFQRQRIIKYKKGKVDQKRAGLRELVACVESYLCHETPPLLDSPVLHELLHTDINALRGQAMKGFEDRIDALLGGFMAAYYWYWGEQRCRVYGDVDAGYIICPRLSLALNGGSSTSQAAR